MDSTVRPVGKDGPALKIIPFNVIRHYEDIWLAVTAAVDDPWARDGMIERVTKRYENILAGTNPPSLWMLSDDQGRGGWFGWVDFPNEPAIWQTTTFLAPRWRGTGIFDSLRCLQVHAMGGCPALG